MTSTKAGPQVGGHRREVDYQKLGPSLLIASSLVLAIRTARWSPTHRSAILALCSGFYRFQLAKSENPS